MNQVVTPTFRQFRASISSVEWSVKFWEHFVQHTLKDWVDKQDNRMVFQAIFAAFDLPADNHEGWLWVGSQEPFTLTADELEDYRAQFFRMVGNLALVKTYNALEMFLFQSALLAYFPDEVPPAGKDATKLGDNLIKKEYREKRVIGKLETKNNRHLIAFVKEKSAAFSSFVQQPIRINMQTTWAGFFEFASILRHVHAHHGGLLTRDILNDLQKTSKEVFNHCFSYERDADGFYAVYPKEGDPFNFFITLCKDFAVNSAKFIFGQSDLTFLNLNRSF